MDSTDFINDRSPISDLTMDQYRQLYAAALAGDEMAAKRLGISPGDGMHGGDNDKNEGGISDFMWHQLLDDNLRQLDARIGELNRAAAKLWDEMEEINRRIQRVHDESDIFEKEASEAQEAQNEYIKTGKFKRNANGEIENQSARKLLEAAIAKHHGKKPANDDEANKWIEDEKKARRDAYKKELAELGNDYSRTEEQYKKVETEAKRLMEERNRAINDPSLTAEQSNQIIDESLKKADSSILKKARDINADDNLKNQIDKIRESKKIEASQTNSADNKDDLSSLMASFGVKDDFNNAAKNQSADNALNMAQIKPEETTPTAPKGKPPSNG